MDVFAAYSIGGGSDVVNIKPLDRNLIAFSISAYPATYPPKTPKPLPRVPLIKSISSCIPIYSAIPPPVFP